MKNQKVADHYNKIYSDDEHAYSGEPLPLVKLLLEHITSGRVLEIGAGGGRNALFLAANGFDVLATDISTSSIEKIQQRAKEMNVSLQTEVWDAAETEFAEDFDVIICTYTFHHLLAEDAELVIRKMQQHTKPSGFNLITAFTKDGDFYKKNPSTPKYYLDGKQELEKLYSGWSILKSFEKDGKARALDTEGKPQFNIFAGLLAQKR